ncbi:stage IV sporulation protein [Gracilibacillus boraciitolerans JCM 21714]|uniref:Stage IV sporulation protein n=1 Tax=Gracilibacillus boraciitolerans JCM 21714 TaxID=1298598 RepID=W4VCK1_9BACI|nr:stage IV sporulation protein [Gracilibacillus boraciitolerans JCM 21714]
MFFYKKNWLTGYVTIKVIGPYPERFFDLCARYQVPSWDIIKKSSTVAIGKIKLSDLSKLRKVKKKSIHKIYFSGRSGLPFVIKKLVAQKPLLIGITIAFIIIFMLSNIIWRIDVAGLDREIKLKVLNQVEEYGLEKGNFQWNVESPATLQKKILEDIPELLWIGVKKNGSAFHLKGVEKLRLKNRKRVNQGI